MTEQGDGQARTKLDSLTRFATALWRLVREIGIVVTLIAAVYSASKGKSHDAKLDTITDKQQQVQGEVLQTQVVASKTLVNTTGDPKDAATLKLAKSALDEHNAQSK